MFNYNVFSFFLLSDQRLLHSLSTKDLELQKSTHAKRTLEKQLEDMLKQKEQELSVCLCHVICYLILNYLRIVKAQCLLFVVIKMNSSIDSTNVPLYWELWPRW